MDSIDSFIGIPILISVTLGLLLFALLLIAKLRNTSKISVIVFPCILIFFGGMIYAFFSQKMIYLIFTNIVVEFLLLVYGLVLAVSDPLKQEKRDKNPLVQEVDVDLDAVQKEKEKCQKIINLN